MNARQPLRCCGVTLTPLSRSTPDAELSREEVRRTYDRVAWIYDLWARLTESKAQARALELADVRDASSILEVAVGTGRTFAELVARNPNGETLGVDLTAGMLDKARRRLEAGARGNYRLEQGDAFALLYADDRFDLLVNQYMFDLIAYAQMDDLMVELARVLKPGGRLVLTNMTEAKSVWGGIYKLVYHVSPRAMGGCRPVALSERLRQHGFEVASREYVQQMLFPSEIVVAYKR